MTSQLLTQSLIRFRGYQRDVFLDRTTGVVVLHWSRQIGKSFTLAAWAVDRLLTRPGRLVTVLSNSRDNGAEFVLKCHEVCNLLGVAIEGADLSPDISYDNMRFELTITVKGRKGRIKVLAANPRTARGFSGDLILDEFAFHEDSNAIWEAAEPILSSNPDFLCRIASTGNGVRNMFYRMATEGKFKVSRVRRTDAYAMGVKIYDANTRKPITPDEAREQAMDKAAYDQNYECAFANESGALLTQELISEASSGYDGGVICEQDWSERAVEIMRAAKGPLYAGCDVARRRDFTFVPVGEKDGSSLQVRACLRMRDMRLPDQKRRLETVLKLPLFKRIAIDMTGIGLGLFEFTEEAFPGKVVGVDFSTTVEITQRIKAEGRKAPRVRVTEAMAMNLLGYYEDCRIKHPVDAIYRDDLRKPERITTPGGRVSIAATRDEAGHADHFWGNALMCEAAAGKGNGNGSSARPRAASRFERGRSVA
jgi:phage FluMu gp28-like protein